jgi:hypothetical protein
MTDFRASRCANRNLRLAEFPSNIPFFCARKTESPAISVPFGARFRTRSTSNVFRIAKPEIPRKSANKHSTWERRCAKRPCDFAFPAPTCTPPGFSRFQMPPIVKVEGRGRVKRERTLLQPQNGFESQTPLIFARTLQEENELADCIRMLIDGDVREFSTGSELKGKRNGLTFRRADIDQAIQRRANSYAELLFAINFSCERRQGSSQANPGIY